MKICKEAKEKVRFAPHYYSTQHKNPQKKNCLTLEIAIFVNALAVGLLHIRISRFTSQPHFFAIVYPLWVKKNIKEMIYKHSIPFFLHKIQFNLQIQFHYMIKPVVKIWIWPNFVVFDLPNPLFFSPRFGSSQLDQTVRQTSFNSLLICSRYIDTVI